LQTAAGVDCTARFTSVATAAGRLPTSAALLDGVVTALLPDGRSSRAALARARREKGGRQKLRYFAFDLLHLDGVDLTALPLLERKLALRRLLDGGAAADVPIRYVEHFVGHGRELLEQACKLGVQGIVSKRSSAPHRAGASREWRAVACARQVSAAESAKRPATPRMAGGPTREAARSLRGAPARAVANVIITTPERPVYPRLDFAKLDLAQFYERIADWILPYIADRPLTLVRCEKGVTRGDALRTECKFLRHGPGWHRWASASIRRLNVREQKKIGEYLVIDDKAGLLSLVQGDIIEIHCWNARSSRLEQPDRLVFDLDPAADVPWARVIEAAGLVREQLARIDLVSFAKLTGGKGLHVVVPLSPELGWDVVYRTAALLAGSLVQREPRLFTTDFAKAKRAGRVLLDYKRNHRAAVAVAAYSTRAHPGGSVSVPVSWSELKPTLRSDAYDVRSLPRRLDRLRTDPWHDYWSCRQRLPKALSRKT
jgi:DNA ligase D-like protein (predicted polymerase)